MVWLGMSLLVSGGVVGNKIIGIKILKVSAKRTFQDRVDTHAKYKNLSTKWEASTIKNKDGNHTFMPYNLDDNNLIKW